MTSAPVAVRQPCSRFHRAGYPGRCNNFPAGTTACPRFVSWVALLQITTACLTGHEH
jgi:hypothetical protein